MYGVTTGPARGGNPAAPEGFRHGSTLTDRCPCRADGPAVPDLRRWTPDPILAHEATTNGTGPQPASHDGEDEDVVTVATYNLRNGCHDPETETWDLEPLRRLAPFFRDVDVLFLQEGWGYGAQGQRVLFEVERILGMRALRTPGRGGPLDLVVFVRWPRVGVERHYDRHDPATFEDQYGDVHLMLPGFPVPVVVRSVQWPYASGDARLREAQQLAARAAPDAWSLIAGDLNALWPDRDGMREFRPRWWLLAAHARSHKTLPPGRRAVWCERVRSRSRPWRGFGRVWDAWRLRRRWVTDTRATRVLADAGFVNAASLAGDPTVTVTAQTDNGQGGRIDHILFSRLLAAAFVPGSYRVLDHPLVDAAGDHRPVFVQLDARRLAPGSVARPGGGSVGSPEGVEERPTGAGAAASCSACAGTGRRVVGGLGVGRVPGRFRRRRRVPVGAS
ncbi:hypothetical protein B4N89_45920 [Embleya scabrispora]|uniref:Endonuclease/exonuclease/phosphatase domain-containing protein n=1 Tax=Embleya scabrispora TaxID=159449 RepID=A0A1T3NJE6_9ACTN|nr:endonuclease/exonuclease/phosphatase family protein [Embleya scabrispora]OPC76815.1 hypothetical protein B4N89_45920 [Embleya scabrispora]